MKILVIDDDPDTLVYLTAWLQDQGYEACSATDGRRGMEAILSEEPDLVLLDINMPGQTGVQLYREIRRNQACTHLPVIFITGMADVQIFDDECGPLAEPEAQVEKPIDLEALRIAIEKALR
jgi:CheY-like chemotaxis protein